jgi:serine protein kinase
VNLDNISEEYKKNSPEDLRKERDMSWYIEEYIDNPIIGRNAHQRLADMFDYYGKEEKDDRVVYKLASEDPLFDGENKFFGNEVHKSINEFVNKIKAGGKHMGPEKRIKLLLGPVGSGKSHFDSQVRKYFEDYTRREEGRMYTFKWIDLCDVIESQDIDDNEIVSPMNQDPIVLIPQEQRDDIIKKANDNLNKDYRIRNRQNLDPESQFYMDELMAHYDDDIKKVLDNHVRIIRLVANENSRRCIETFEPKDKKNQDETELTGDVDFSKIGVYGENDPRAFDYSGALCNANRGIFSGEELLKLQQEFLYDFLHASQEQTIKPKNNPRIDIDQVIVGRTNMPEYSEKRNNQKMEAFNDRTKRIDFPYILNYKEEKQIYEKKIENSDIIDFSIEPHTLEMAALFAVLSRIEEPEETSILTKALAYAGENPEDIDIEKISKEGDEDSEYDKEGLSGISPRFISDEIMETIIQLMNNDVDFISNITLLDNIEDGLRGHASIEEENIEDYKTYLEMVQERYKELAIEDVRRAIAYNREEIKRLGEKYMENVMAYISNETVEDEITKEEREPDESFMRDVEEQLNIPKDRKDAFRNEISNWVTKRARDEKSFEPKENDKLSQALERKLWEDKKHNVNFSSLVNTESGDNERIKRLKEMGYSEDGAKQVLEFAGAEVAKGEMGDNDG